MSHVKILLYATFAARCTAWSYLVGCGTSMSNAGHRRFTAQGGGSPVLRRGSSDVACGSNLNPSEQLSLSSSGTSGTFYNTKHIEKNNKIIYVMAGDLLYQVTGGATIVGGSCSSTRSTSSTATVKVGTSGSVQIQVQGQN